MRQAVWSDKKRVVDIIAKTFCKNPGVNWMFRKTNDQEIYLRRLASFAFVKAYNRKGALISTNEKGVALYFKANERKFSFLEFLYRAYFAITSIDLHRIAKVIKREAIRESFRPAGGEYLYFWFLAVLPEGRGAGFELKNELFREATRLHVPIYLETTLKRNQMIYEKIGFHTYREWHDEPEGIHFWFMKWDPTKKKATTEPC
jgi:GNAT superfamily N-acetyltransferase